MILSNAEGRASFVLSPNNKTPCPGMFEIGLIPALYRVSRCDLFGEEAKDVIPRYAPRLGPAGENQGAAFASVAAMIPAVEDEAGIKRYLSLYLS